MNIKNTTATQRISEWRALREQLDENLSDQDHLERVLEFWTSSPVVSFYVDWDNPDIWPTPWEIIAEAEICPSGMAICMYHTLLMTQDRRWDNRCDLALLEDTTHGTFLVVLVDETTLVGFNIGIVAINDTSSTIVARYNFKDGKYINRNPI